MEYRLLGDSGLAVSRLCLGTMTFGAETDRAGSFAQLDAFVEAGGTFIDTADVYSRGVSEQLVGDWLGERADARMLLQVHDELVFEVSEAALDEVRDGVRQRMSAAAELSVPLVVDIGVGANWDEAH